MSVRRYALETLIDVCDNGAFANLSLKDGMQGLSIDEKKWVSALIYTTLDHLELIDYYISCFAKGRVQAKTRGILRLGICQIMFMRTPVSAACNESVKLTKEIGKTTLSSYVNAVLRAVGRAAENDDLPLLPADPVEKLHIRYGYPLFLIKEYLTQYGADFTEALLSCKQHGMTIRAQYPFSPDELEKVLKERGYAYRRGNLVDDAFHLDKGLELANEKRFIDGMITVQSESAMLVCRAVDTNKGKILDACSAPGGKTAYLSSLAQGENEIIAWELHPHRIELLNNTLNRLNVHNARAELHDATVHDPALESSMDAVLLDVPCSGLGLPDKPDIRYRVTDESIRSLCEVQRSILESCCSYVKPGGTLVYSTCTISRRENEDQILDFLKRHHEFKSVSLSPYLPESLAKQGENGMMQLFPHLHGTEGFFIAKVEKSL